MSILFDSVSRCFHLSNARVSYIIGLAAGKYPMLLHWGHPIRRITDDLLSRLTPYTQENFSIHESPLDVLPLECPVFGSGDQRLGMVRVRLADGSRCLDLVYAKHEIVIGKPALDGLPSARGEDAETLILTLRDELSGLAVELLYTIWADTDIIARSMRVVNGCDALVVVENALSCSVDLPQAEGMRLLTLSGAWARERQMVIRPLVPGEQGVASYHGASGLQTSPFLALLGKDANEDSGEVYALSLCYSGSFSARVQVDPFFTARAQIGIAPFNFDWRLAPGEVFQTPEAYLCFSASGLNAMSHSFHSLVHRHITTGPYRNSVRPILINNWEGTYFAFNEDKLVALAAKAKEVGIDLFVLDDGWFGHRDSDWSSLGDWYDHTEKLPNGIAGLSEKIHAMGLMFGLWVEPEMVNPDSDLYRAHPDWCIHCGNRPRLESRHQLVLDLSRKEVRDYIVEVICAALRRGNVDYVKWDMNRNINMWGSEALQPDRLQELGHRYMLGLYDIMGRITSAFPNVLFESCSSGGGRFDLGILCYMPQTWTSDDTDAHMRCRIQYATSLVMPPSTMGAHVSAVPNHQAGRMTPLFARAAVAMGGTYGYELDLLKLPQEELDTICELNKTAHSIQNVVYYGDFIRLQSPFEGNETAWMSVSVDKREAIVTHVFAQAEPNVKPRLLKLRGLDPQLDYEDIETGKIYGGDELMYHGIALKTAWGDYTAQQFRLKAR